jgi:S-DNA-T family DNA segregation ATPase FtsK/SpoIIIE
MPPRLATDPVVLSAPPQPVGRDGGANWVYLLMPLLSSFSVAGYMIVEGKKTLIFLGICFVLVSIGVTLSVRMSMSGRQRKARIRARDMYLEHLVEVRQMARQVAQDQRTVAAWAFPSPYRLWAIADEGRRVWERRATDPDFLKLCIGVGTAPLSTPIRLATRNDPTVEYDQRAKGAADRLISSMSEVGSQPALIDLTEAGVVSVLGPGDVARGAVRALLLQIAVLHAPDDVGVAVATGGEDWRWAKWLPHTHDQAAGEAGVVPLVSEEFEGVADRLREALDAAARRPARRSLLLGRGPEAPVRRLVVILDRYDPRSAWARSPRCGCRSASARTASR